MHLSPVEGIKYFRAIAPIHRVHIVGYKPYKNTTSIFIEGKNLYHTSRGGQVYREKEYTNKKLYDCMIDDPLSGDGLLSITKLNNNIYFTQKVGDTLVLSVSSLVSDTLAKKKVMRKYHNDKTLSFTGKLLSNNGKAYLSTVDGCIKEIINDRVDVLVHGLCNPASFIIEGDELFISDDRVTYARVYKVKIDNIPIDVTALEPIFEYPYADDIGSGIVGGVIYHNKYVFGDKGGRIKAIEFLNNKWVQTLDHRIESSTVNDLFYDDNSGYIFVCTNEDIKICELKDKVRTS